VGSRREWGLAAGLLAVVMVLAVMLAPPERRDEWDPRASSYLLSPRGTRALFHTLEELGIPARRRITPWVEADSLRGPLLVLGPTEGASPAELAALGRWLGHGGMLVYAAAPGDPMLDSLGLVLARRRSAGGDSLARPVGPHPWTEGVDTVRGFGWVFADSSRTLRERRAVRLLATGRGEPVALLLRRGKGQVLALSDPAPLGNAALRRSGMALPVARAAASGARPGGAVWFDEYHQGFRGDGSVMRGVGRFLFHTPAGWAVLQLAAVALGVLLLAGRRFGAPLPLPPARRRSPLEHVEALAGAYRQAGARRIARRLLVAGMARRMGRRPLRESQGEGEVLDEITTRLPVAQDAARELREEWSRGEDASLVALARGVDRLLDEVKRP
jgi:hypothetical protein